MSPFSYADKIKLPLLMIHGDAANNQGTFPIQSERFLDALKGHGARCAWYFCRSKRMATRRVSRWNRCCGRWTTGSIPYVKNPTPAKAEAEQGSTR